MPDAGNERRNLPRRKLPALSRLRALRHFDFQFLRSHQIFGGNPESSGRNLFDLVRSCGLALAQQRVFAAFSGIAARAQRIHGQGECAVRLRTQRAQ